MERTARRWKYSKPQPEGERAVNRPGFAHQAFSVANVSHARREVLSHGGESLGDVVTTTKAAGASVPWCYVSDPEGNILELQRWS